MARVFIKTLSEFIARFWPISKSEEQILEEQRSVYRSDPSDGTAREDPSN